MARLPNSGSSLRLENTGSGLRLPDSNSSGLSLGTDYSVMDKIGGFALSTIESFPELFGIEPTDKTQEFRAVAPVSGFASQIAGAFVPYVGAAKILRAAPLVEGGLGAFEALAGSSKIGRAALGAIGEASVVEAARLGLSATPLPEMIYESVTGRDPEMKPLKDLAGDAVINIAAGGALGAGFGALASRFAKGPKIQDLVPGAAPDQPLLAQIRALNETIAKAQDPADPLTLADDVLERLTNERERRIKWNFLDTVPSYSQSGETVPARDLYRQDLGKSFRPLEGEVKSRPVASFLNRANNWRSGDPDKLTATRRLIYDPLEKGGYSSKDELDSVFEKLGVDRQNLGMFAQDIKTIEVKTGTGKRPEPSEPSFDDSVTDLPASMTPEQSRGVRLLSGEPEWNKSSASDPLLGRARGLQRRFMGKPFADVGSGWKLAKEKGPDGLFVMAKKIKGDPLNAAPGDQWAFLRTDRPDVFAPKAQRMQDEVLRSGFFPVSDDLGPVGEYMFDSARNARKLYDKNEVTKRATKSGALGSMAKESLETIGTYAAPTAMLGSRNPLLAKGFSMIDFMNGLADARVNTFMNGETKLDPNKSIIGNVLSIKGPKTDGFNDFIRTMSKDELQTIVNLDEESIPLDAIKALHARGEISENVLRFFENGQALADETVRRADALAGVVNDPGIARTLETFQSRNAHYALTREYPGAYKYVLEDEAGNWIGTATGISPADAGDVANEIIKKQAAKGQKVVRGGLIDEALLSGEDYTKLQSAVRSPGFIKSRSKLIGYELSRGEMTHKRLSDLVARNLKMRENFFRDIALRENTADILQRLHRESPQDAIALDKRIRIIQGDEGEFGRVQNAMADKLLHGVGLSGKDSATNIVRTTQKLLGAWTFGFGNLPQIVMNLTGIFQTLMPHVAFALNASPATLSRNFASMPMLDSANNVKGVFGVLSPWKVLKNTMDIIATPIEKQDPAFIELFETMVKRGKLAPRFMEEQFGTNGALLSDPIKSLREGHSFVEMLNSVNQMAITKTEEINRAATVAASYVLGKEAGLTGERLAIFTQEMIAQTAYNYSTVDRATMFTTPLGSLSGTFKNWIFHYMGSMLKYATAGKEGIAPLMWQTASTGLIGGAAATPLVIPLADAFSRFATGEDAMTNLYAAAGNLGLDERVADGVMYGLPGAMGVSLSSQAASPGADPERDASMLFSVAAFDRMRALSGGVKDAIVAARTTGETPWDDDVVRSQLIRALAPRTIYRAMSVGSDGALRSMATGNKVMEGLGIGDHLLYASGFNPTELDKTYAVYNDIRDSQEKKKALVSEFGQTLAQAWEEGDDRMATRIFVRAMAIGLDTSSILRSAKARTDRGAEPAIDFTSTPEDQERFSFMFDGDDE